MDNRRRRNLRVACLLVAVLLVGVCGPMGWCFWETWGPGIWLRLLPAPSGIVRETDVVDSGTMTLYWTRSYQITQPFDEVVDFFKEKMPKRGWKLVEEKPRVGAVDLVFKGRFPWSRKIGIYVLGPDPEIKGDTTLVRIYAHTD